MRNIGLSPVRPAEIFSAVPQQVSNLLGTQTTSPCSDENTTDAAREAGRVLPDLRHEHFFHGKIGSAARQGIKLSPAVGPDRIGAAVIGDESLVIALLISVIDS